MTPRIRIAPAGRTANQMLQYMLAANVQRLICDLEICGYNLPDWGLVSTSASTPDEEEIKLGGQHIFCDDIVHLIKNKIHNKFFLKDLGFRISNYAPAEYYRELFGTPLPKTKGYGNEHVVFHIRGGDILRSAHRDYSPIPVSYIDAVLSKADASPVFIGQLEESYYLAALRKRYPNAVYAPARTPLEDFEIMRASHQIAISISSFSWAAAWLSNATKIHLPVGGMLNPLQRPDIDLLPIGDKRYVFYHFDKFEWNATEADISQLWVQREHALLDDQSLRRIKKIAARRTRLDTHWARMKLYTRAYLR